ncbi:vacuolar amino acid transporter 1 [Cinnamomum micranthum f. kanehirae]|uniref:Vacuolar amino acid transporter 1 n=1 Tax=Cinnamomum micranthum f. kanehirae TaxID=337451 RepID=A0A443NSW4_9MAGN|nr:vacuolar amino acid transporter 1 [Cinnamomum micranthum f. kanehirae]
MKMKTDEELGHDRRVEFETDDEENEAETVADSDEVDDDDDTECSKTSSSNKSDQSDDGLGNYVSSWPQSYRQSMDMLTTVAPPNMNYLASPRLARLGSSFFSSQQNQPLIPEFDTSLNNPLIDKDRSTHSSHLENQSFQKNSSFRSHQCSYAQAVLNGVNILCGVGLLATPYAIKEGGWLGLSLLFIFGIISCYTGVLLKQCLDSTPGLQTYPDIGQVAFGTVGRLFISVCLYIELYSSCVEYIILMSDNLSSLFPNAHVNIAGLHMSPQRAFAVATTIAVLPTVWLRDLGFLSYISAGGVIASLLVVFCLLWVGVVDQVGFHPVGTALDITNIPVAIGLYAFCYAGHAVFPNIYSSMRNKAEFPSVLMVSFAICWIIYTGVGVLGFLMFGESIESQFTLNLPHQFVASKIGVWTTVVNPLTKYALTITPVALSLEELLPLHNARSHFTSIAIRTALVLSTLVVALSIPFFGFLMALIGSFLSMIVALIFPCASYLKIMRGRVTRLQVTACALIIMVGVVCSCFGSYSAIKRIADSMG